jgi:ATP-dependent Clp protease protease subunit
MQNPMNTYYPTVIVEENGRERVYDLASRLLKDRLVYLNGQVDDNSAGSIVQQLLFLEAEDPEAPITLIINSPGGVVTAGMSIYDTMNFISCPVHTLTMGQAASMGAFLLAAGEPGHRISLPHARVMIHQPLGGAQGQASDMELHVKEILRMKTELTQIMADSTNKKTSYKRMLELTDRDNFLSAKEALELGLIDEIKLKR